MFNTIEDQAGVEGRSLMTRPTVSENGESKVPPIIRRTFEVVDNPAGEWMRLPAPRSRCEASGLSRTTLNEAIDRGDVRAISVRKPGATRGIKLMNRRSLLDWLARLEAEQHPQPEKGGQPE